MSQQEFDVPLEVLLERELMRRYGPIIGNDDLLQALGYPSKEAFRQAIVRKTVPIPIFDLTNRRGKFALVLDLARWLVDQRARATNLTTAIVAGPQMAVEKGGPMS
jgi:hypothetical protein